MTMFLSLLQLRISMLGAVVLALISVSLTGCAWFREEQSYTAMQPVNSAAEVPVKKPRAVERPKPKDRVTYKPAAARTEPAPSADRQRAEPGCAGSEECIAQLKAMIEDPKRSWIGRREPPIVFATGVRPFAYRALRERLNCNELAMAVGEMKDAAKTFAGPLPDISADLAVRVKDLSAEVGSELREEAERRCRPYRRAGGPAAKP
jgi:hypothetical protein